MVLPNNINKGDKGITVAILRNEDDPYISRLRNKLMVDKVNFIWLKDTDKNMISMPDEQINTIILCKNFDKVIASDIIKSAKNLKHIISPFSGVDHFYPEIIDIIKDRNVRVHNNPYNTIAVSEYCIASILNAYKNQEHYSRDVKKKESRTLKEWRKSEDTENGKSFEPIELNGKNLIIIGYGKIGKELAKRALAFGVNVFAIRKNVNIGPENLNVKVHSFKDLKTILPKMDIISINLPYTKETDKIIGNHFFKMVKNNAVLINASRGGIVNEEELLSHIEKFKKVYIDVFEKEPISKDSPFCHTKDSVVITPHHAGNCYESEMIRKADCLYDEIIRIRKGELCQNVIDIERGY
jgi:phosphoglycerate dehydrogenase-like enzyme